MHKNNDMAKKEKIKKTTDEVDKYKEKAKSRKQMLEKLVEQIYEQHQPENKDIPN